MCPVVKIGKLCVEADPSSKLAWISEELCIGCGICVKKCPFEAILIINLPKNLESQTTHRYGQNTFKLHRMPMPRPGQVLGLVGTNGIGKSTALKVLAGKLKPNLGRFTAPPDWEEILTYFRGSELQNYFTKLLEDDIKAVIKPQYVDHIPRAIKGNVRKILTDKNDGAGIPLEKLLADLDLEQVKQKQQKPNPHPFILIPHPPTPTTTPSIHPNPTPEPEPSLSPHYCSLLEARPRKLSPTSSNPDGTYYPR
jgi:ATP-binding cassette, sub-family E, member 1